MNLITYLINLDGSTERYAQAKTQLDKQNIPFERVSAFDGRQLDLSTVPEYDEAHALNYMGRTLKGGELGCYFSHLDCARRFLATDADYGMVLEDDMLLTENIYTTISQTLNWLEQQNIQFDLCHISANKRKIYTTLNTINEHEIIRAHYFPMTTTGLIWSRQGAESFIANHNKIFAPVDNYLRLWLTKSNLGLSIWPPLVRTTGAESDIDGHIAKRKTSNRSIKYGWIKQRRLWADKLIALCHKLF